MSLFNEYGLDRVEIKRLRKAFRGATAPIYFDTPDPARVLGIDVHQYSGVVNWEKSFAGGINFTLIKSSHGTLKSRFFDENWKGAKDILPRGAWHWLYPSTIFSANRQAQLCFEFFKNDLGEIPLQVDYEWTYHKYKKANPRPEDLYGFMETWKRLTGRECIIYTSQGFWNEFGSQKSYYSDKELWVANYKVDKPNLPKPWTKWLFWQWTENGNGELYGVNKYEEWAVDLNYYNGTLAEFNARFLGEVTSPPQVDKIGALLKSDALRLNDSDLSAHVIQLNKERPELF